LETPIEEGSKASQKGFKGQPKGSRTHRQLGDRTLRHVPSPRFNSMAVKDGKLLEGQLGRGPFARFEMPIKQISKASQKAQKCTFFHTETAWHCGTDRAFEG